MSYQCYAVQTVVPQIPNKEMRTSCPPETVTSREKLYRNPQKDVGQFEGTPSAGVYWSAQEYTNVTIHLIELHLSQYTLVILTTVHYIYNYILVIDILTGDISCWNSKDFFNP